MTLHTPPTHSCGRLAQLLLAFLDDRNTLIDHISVFCVCGVFCTSLVCHSRGGRFVPALLVRACVSPRRLTADRVNCDCILCVRSMYIASCVSLSVILWRELHSLLEFELTRCHLHSWNLCHCATKAHLVWT